MFHWLLAFHHENCLDSTHLWWHTNCELCTYHMLLRCNRCRAQVNALLLTENGIVAFWEKNYRGRCKTRDIQSINILSFLTVCLVHVMDCILRKLNNLNTLWNNDNWITYIYTLWVKNSQTQWYLLSRELCWRIQTTMRYTNCYMQTVDSI